jgi:hypothetical protein
MDSFIQWLSVQLRSHGKAESAASPTTPNAKLLKVATDVKLTAHIYLRK